MITIDLRISTVRYFECIGLLVIFLWLIVHPVFAGAVLRVGNGETYTSIQAAIDAASPGDRIFVEDTAEPYGGFRVTTPDLWIRGDGGPVITSEGTGIQITAKNTTLDGFVVQNCPYGISSTGDDVTITNTSIIGSFGDAISSSGTNLSLIGCHFESLIGYGMLLSEIPHLVQDVISDGNPAFYGRKSGTITRLTLNDPNSTEVSFTFSGGIKVDGKPQTLKNPPLRSSGQFVHLTKSGSDSCINMSITIPENLPEEMNSDGLWIWTYSDEDGWAVAGDEAGLSFDGSAVYANFTSIPVPTKNRFTLAPLSTNPPILERVNPESAINNGTIPITIQGNRFWGEMDVKLIREEEDLIQADAITLEDPDTLTCSINLTDAFTGQWNLVVANPIGSEEHLPFSIEGEPLLVDTITPHTATNNGTVIVDLVGSGFMEGTQVNLTNQTAGISVEPLQFQYTDNTRCNATFDLIDLREGDYFLNVWKEDGTANLTVFSIANAAPIISGIAPTTAANNETVLIDVTGSGFRSGTMATISNSSWTLEPTEINRVSNNEVTATFDLVDVFEGMYYLNILQDDGQKATAEFSVNNAMPIINCITPDSATNNGSVCIDVTGTGYRSGTVISISNGSWQLEPTEINRVSNNEVTATFDLVDVFEGMYQLNILQNDGQEATAEFSVNNAKPIINCITPNSGTNNETLCINVTGTGFRPGTVVTISNDSWALETAEINRICNNEINTIFNLTDVSEGIYQLCILEDDRQKATASFSVTNAEPVIYEVTPEPTEPAANKEITHSDDTGSGSGFRSGTNTPTSNHPENKLTTAKNPAPEFETKQSVSKKESDSVPESESNNLPDSSTDELKEEGHNHNSEPTSPDIRQPENTITETFLEQIPESVAETFTEIFDEIADAFSNLFGSFGTLFGANLPGDSR